MTQEKTILVWDPLVRLFHWSLVVCVASACMTGEGFLRLHVVTGCVVIGLILFRLLWGVIGPHFALFRSFVLRPVEVFAYLQSVVISHPTRYIGHNPAGGMMVVVLLAVTIATALLGLILYGVGEFSGPFASWGLISGVHELSLLKKIHGMLANGVLLLVALHVMGVMLTGWQHRENLIKSMFTGSKTL